MTSDCRTASDCVGLPPVALPWPDKVLHPNARPHWAVRSRAVKSARTAAAWLAVAAGWTISAPIPTGRLYVWIDAHPPDRRRRDEDGVQSALKPALDGLADALGVDDHRFRPQTELHDEPVPGGRVVIRLATGPRP